MSEGAVIASSWLPVSVSVVVPVYNEEENARPLVESIVDSLRELDTAYEMIVVDDGSSDATMDRLRGLQREFPELVVLALRRNFGQTLALQAGLDRARGDVIVTMDGDLQNDPSDIPHLLRAIHDGADAVSGWRKGRQDAVVLRKIPSWIANRMIRVVTGVTVHDQGCSLKAYRRKIIEGIDLYADMHRFIAILTMGIGARITEVEVQHHARVAGDSKYGISRTFKVLVDLFTIQMLTWFREGPIRFFALMGLPFLLVAFASFIASLLVPSGAVVLSAVTLLSGITLTACLSLGLLGEALLEESQREVPSPVVCQEWKDVRS